MATNFGQDSSCLSDVGLYDQQIVDPFILIGQRVIRRLTTPAGSLANVGDDPNFGWDVRQLINARLSPSTIAQYQSQINSECVKDEEVATSNATIAVGAGGSITISIQLTSAAGPFTLTLPVQSVTAAQIFSF